MVDTLAHRGPDGRGVYRGENILLGHRRLAILDPTPAGSQPMKFPDAEIVVTYNGEIYNFLDLRSRLAKDEFHFKTRSDTEVLLAAYVAWGTGAVEHLNGIFAFAIWDAQRKQLWLARDHFGVKPLFYYFHDGLFIFASEIKAILQYPGYVREMDPRALNSYLSFGYVPAPLTIFKNIMQLHPASQLLVNEAGASETKYWTPAFEAKRTDLPSALDEFECRLNDATRRQMISDVPLGGFLSGGLDSAAVLLGMTRHAGKQVAAYSIAFSDESHDESRAAKETAGFLGIDLNVETISLEIESDIESLMPFNEELLADSSAIAVSRLCQYCHTDIKVALSGDGADEILAGYYTYPATYIADYYRRLPGTVRALARIATSKMKPTNERYSAWEFANRFVYGAEQGRFRDFASWRVCMRDSEMQSILRPEFSHAGDQHPPDLYSRYLHELPEGATLLKRMLYADLSFFLPNDMLVKVDRMSMRSSLEVRVPFLDRDLVEYCLGLPDHYLLTRFGRGKYILRKYLARKLHPAVSKRRKFGFNVPVSKAFRGILFDRLIEAIRDRDFRLDGPLDVDAVESFARKHSAGKIDAGHALYAIYLLALWWRRWIKK